MDNLTEEEKKKIFIKLGISILLLVIVMIIGLVLVGSAPLGKLKGEAFYSEETLGEECSSLDSDMAVLNFTTPTKYSAIKILNKETQKEIIKKPTKYDTNGNLTIMVDPGTYDILIEDSFYLKAFYEDSVLLSGETYSFSGSSYYDFNQDGYSNEEDRVFAQKYIGTKCSSYEGEERFICVSIDSGDQEYGNISTEDINDIEISNTSYDYFKNFNRYYGNIVVDKSNITNSSITLGKNEEFTLAWSNGEYLYKNGVWQSANTSLVGVTKEGIISGITVGTTAVNYVVDDQIVESIPVITDDIGTISIIKNDKELTENNELIVSIGNEFELNYQLSQENNFDNCSAVWSSSNTNVASLTQNADSSVSITPKTKGVTTISVQIGYGKTASVILNVD